MTRWAVAAMIVTTSGPVRAEPPARDAAAVSKAVLDGPRKPKGPPREPKAPPDIGLAIETSSTRGPWTMRITNAGSVPVRVVADARLLSFEVTPRSVRTPVRCELPSDMRPKDDLERALVVPPKGSYAETFEPRLYCFGTKLDALAPGAIVVGRLGWRARSKIEPPFEASPIEGVEPELGPLKSVDASPVAIPDEPTPSIVVPGPIPSLLDPDTPRLSMEGSTWVDADAPHDIEISITLRNEGPRPVVVRVRPDVLAFDVIGTAGAEHCAWPTMPSAAMREMFTKLAPKESETLVVTLDSYCTAHSLDQGGLIVVRPRFDSRKASGIPLGLRTFDGELIATTPTIVRLHRGAAPRLLVRPRLEKY
ncbi:MAG: hypothetical protein M3O46_15360 [Myxococcota bacterium]|nr:hypothetical protein [Myxococcota bacterium]